MTSRRSFFIAILCPILFTSLCSAQSFLFVSPNTREHMTDESAWDSLSSFEQTNFLAVANYLAAKLCAKPQVWSAEGLNGNNTENSSLLTGCASSKARFLGELLGRYAHQKWVLVFDSDNTGSERLLVVTFATDRPADATRDLRQSGISAGTVVPGDKQARFYLWAKDNSLDARVRSFVEANHATLEQIAGRATLIGNEHRASAQRIFDQRILAYERAHHESFSKLLWSSGLHDLGLATTRLRIAH